LLTNPAEPACRWNAAMSLTSTVLRGVGFRGGQIPIAKTFAADRAHYRNPDSPPSQPMFISCALGVNYFSQLTDNITGSTQLQAIPAHSFLIPPV
jgi:hypothetical protein